jgi:hypothetical protein
MNKTQFKDQQLAVNEKAFAPSLALLGKPASELHSRTALSVYWNNRHADAKDLATIALREFQGDIENSRHAMPHWNRETTWMTNGYMAIGIPGITHAFPEYTDPPIDFGSLIERISTCEPVTVDVTGTLNNAALWGELEECQIKGEQCKKCDGRGSQECDLGHEHECQSCTGNGHYYHRTKLFWPGQFAYLNIHFAVITARLLYRTLLVCEIMGQEQLTLVAANSKGTHWRSGTMQFIIMPKSVSPADPVNDFPELFTKPVDAHIIS